MPNLGKIAISDGHPNASKSVDIHDSNRCRIYRPTSERDTVRNDNERSCQNACTAPSCDCSSNDQRYGVWSDATNQTADLEDGHGGEKGPFDIEYEEDPPVRRLESTSAKADVSCGQSGRCQALIIT